MEKNQIKQNNNAVNHKPFTKNNQTSKLVSDTSVKNVFTITDLWFIQKTVRTACSRRRVHFN